MPAARFLRWCTRMVLGAIGAGLGIAQQVMGMVGQAKGNKGGGGEEAKAEAPAKAEEAGKAAGGEGAAKEQANPVDRFVQMIDKANGIADIKKIRDQALEGVKPEQRENARRKLDQAILKKLGIGQPGPNGDIQVPLTRETQQILQQLGMKPDEIKDGAGGPAPDPGGAPKAAAPKPGTPPP
jgi:hypothetical protein